MRVTKATKLRLPARNTVETVCLLSNRKYLRKPDATINISLDMKEYYEILDRKAEKKATETAGRDQPTEGKTE